MNHNDLYFAVQDIVDEMYEKNKKDLVTTMMDKLVEANSKEDDKSYLRISIADLFNLIDADDDRTIASIINGMKIYQLDNERVHCVSEAYDRWINKCDSAEADKTKSTTEEDKPKVESHVSFTDNGRLFTVTPQEELEKEYLNACKQSVEEKEEEFFDKEAEEKTVATKSAEEKPTKTENVDDEVVGKFSYTINGDTKEFDIKSSDLKKVLEHKENDEKRKKRVHYPFGRFFCDPWDDYFDDWFRPWRY